MNRITYFVHGTTTDNEKDLATGWLPGELSKLGVEQAETLPQKIVSDDFEVVFCSDLGRAIDSARLGFAKTHPIVINKLLREANYGDFNGKPGKSRGEITDYIEKPFPGGESYKDVEKRLAEF